MTHADCRGAADNDKPHHFDSLLTERAIVVSLTSQLPCICVGFRHSFPSYDRKRDICRRFANRAYPSSLTHTRISNFSSASKMTLSPHCGSSPPALQSGTQAPPDPLIQSKHFRISWKPVFLLIYLSFCLSHAPHWACAAGADLVRLIDSGGLF